MQKIELTCGGFATVDDQDADRLRAHVWTNVGGYAARGSNGRTVYMHREIMKSAVGIEVDHIDGNPLNNSRANLRHVTRSQNNANRSGWGASGLKGVVKIGEKYRATLCHNYKTHYLGMHDTPRQAAAAYNKKAFEVYGEFAKLNDIS